MRLFLALPLPQDILDYLVTIKKDLGNRDAKINWVAKKNMHLTLKFFGNITSAHIPALQKALHTIRSSAFNVTLSQFGVFPSIDNPRVLWVGLIPEEPLFTLQSLIDQETLSFGKQEHTFSAHITLGRIKSFKQKKLFLEKFQALSLQHKTISFDHFFLYQSTLRSSGPSYKVLEEYTLS